MNKYNMCVAKKETKGRHQLTMLWHIDDLKISCKDKLDVTHLICYLKQIYGDKIAVHRGGEVHTLG